MTFWTVLWRYRGDNCLLERDEQLLATRLRNQELRGQVSDLERVSGATWEQWREAAG